ncbi:hypothetical protein PMAYCL1PPCAC_21801 [Pristionchus mayeri]|uniref:Uncharacterized protein n=1 Tax=Pristionchus mayeri TaxID=1317129 RepID=A0AAN5CV65_9BILA|nr:hypothetical protein PMAYCL1PPCAC_21801 [Pristionchus mayeri]
MFYAMRIIYFLTWKEPEEPMTEHEKLLRTWMIDRNIFSKLFESIVNGDDLTTMFALKCIVNLCGTAQIPNRDSLDIANKLVVNHLHSLKKKNHKYHFLRALNALCAENHDVQKSLAFTDAFNVICTLVTGQSTMENGFAPHEVKTLRKALKFCLGQLRLKIASANMNRLWTEEGEKAHLTGNFFALKFANMLLKILQHGPMDLKSTSLQVILAALDLPTKRFVTTLMSAIDEYTGQNVTTIIFHAVNKTLREESCNNEFIQAAVDLFNNLIEISAAKASLVDLAKTITTHLPFEIDCCQLANSNEALAFIRFDGLQDADSLLTMPIDVGLRDSLSEYIQFNTFNFPLNLLFNTAFDNNELLITKMLHLCKKMVVDEELKSMWIQYHHKFNSLHSENNEISLIADEIMCLLEERTLRAPEDE